MLPPRLRRTLSTRAPAQDDLPSSRVADGIGARKGKSKQDYGDVLENTPESTGDQPQSDSIPTSGATIESRLLTRRSRTNSRASSVASSSSQHSASSRLTHPSPTLRKNAPLPLVFTHSHGVLHHHHGRPRPSHSHLEQRGRSPASTTMEPGPSRPNPDTSSLLSSPVTRSHCRFHKVSIPREEDGPRIYFVIPGCSLGDAELMKEEEIIDHGPATMEDHARLISDIDDLALDPYVVAAMRQLAGVDLLREGELYYLPQAGEDIRWKGESKWQVVKGKVENMDSASARHKLEPTSSRILKTSHHAASRAPPSRTESTSSSISTQQTSRLSTNASVSGSELSDLEDDEPASRKHRRLDDPAPTVNDEASTSEVLSKSSNAASHRLKSRNRKQLSTEASAYNPERDESDDSDDDRIAEVKRKRRGVKRGRTINAVEEQPESISHVLKKRKVRPLDTQ
ncbi:hypothetical protein OBBRIDRAFT_637818 [Obba rivulosa]|uniref:Uncharacterized protein n=1 Tax=Obba rivulosa TaxID=1052685 RepID=A0A8E2ARZ2_9APHY|nr:hypothetical protein OBBRIDRAFT_637818 [Obba rivulosa]